MRGACRSPVPRCSVAGLCRRPQRADPAATGQAAQLHRNNHHLSPRPATHTALHMEVGASASAAPHRPNTRAAAAAAAAAPAAQEEPHAGTHPRHSGQVRKACSFRLLPLNPCAVHCSHVWCVSGCCFLAVANGGRSYVSDATTLTRVTATPSAGSAGNRSSSCTHSRFSPLFLPSRRSPPVLFLLSPCSAVRVAASTS